MLKSNMLQFRARVKQHIIFLMDNSAAFDDDFTEGARLETFYNVLEDEKNARLYEFPYNGKYTPIISAQVIAKHIEHGTQEIKFNDNLQDIVETCASWFCENEIERKIYKEKYMYKYNHARDKQKILDSYIFYYAGRIAYVFEKMYKEGRKNG